MSLSNDSTWFLGSDDSRWNCKRLALLDSQEQDKQYFGSPPINVRRDSGLGGEQSLSVSPLSSDDSSNHSDGLPRLGSVAPSAESGVTTFKFRKGYGFPPLAIGELSEEAAREPLGENATEYLFYRLAKSIALAVIENEKKERSRAAQFQRQHVARASGSSKNSGRWGGKGGGGSRGCEFCRNNARFHTEKRGEAFDETVGSWNNHHCKDANGQVVCPVLFQYECPECKATGALAHTIRYCPRRKEKILRGLEKPPKKSG